MGEVYLARDERLGREVAVKVLPQSALTNEAIRKRLRKEARALSKLSHPNIETLLEFDSQGNVEYLVVEYIAGTSLDDTLTKGPLPEKEIARLGVQLANGLAAAHAQKVVHCDLKPANLRITPDGRLKILDFGIAKLLKPPRETIGTNATTDSASGDQATAGTLPYMAPEQLQSQPVDARSDTWAAGAVLYEMATGQRPFREETGPRLTDAILHQPLVPPRALNSRISPELERIIIKCLEKEPENRYQSAQDLEVDLRQLALPRTAESIRTFGPTRTRWQIAALAAACAVVLGMVMVLMNVGGVRDWLFRVGGPGRIESIAVLPLENLSGDTEQDYFAEGMTDELTTALAQISSLRVISRTSAMLYKGTHKPLPEIAHELNVDAVVEGTVLRSGDEVRITAQLIYAPTDRYLWAKSYQRDLQDVLKLQAEVASAIANEIEIAVTPQERARLASAPAVVPTAYEAYLKGRFHWNRSAERDWLIARQYFEQATQLDPNYAPAYAGLADYYWLTDELPPQIRMPKAKQYALKALEIDPNLAEAHASLAEVRFLGDWNWPEAEKEFKRALELDPGSGEAHRRYTDYLSEMGRADEAIAEVRRTQKLDPLSTSTQVAMGWTFYFARRYDEAIEQCGKVVGLEANSVNAHNCLGLSYLAKKMYEQAVQECQKAVSLSGNDPARAVDLARAYAQSGNKAAARSILNAWREHVQQGYIPSFFFAQVHVALGEKDEGLNWLEKAYTERDSRLVQLMVDPAFDSVRPDPRFQNLMHRLDFPPYAHLRLLDEPRRAQQASVVAPPLAGHGPPNPWWNCSLIRPSCLHPRQRPFGPELFPARASG
ncbi:MAG: protein kinase [Acidobacteriia bacterium]|nr:protein kinase [Terriglobia bacterium]